MTLREQLKEIAGRRINKEFVEHTHLPAWLRVLARDAFTYEWKGHDVEVIRHACKLYDRGPISIDEPAHLRGSCDFNDV